MFKRFRASLSFFVIVISISFFLIHRILFLYPGIIETGVSYVVYPFLLLQKTIVDPITSFQNNRKTAQQFIDMLATLQKEKDDLRAELVALQAQKQFLTETEELRAYKKRYKVAPHGLVHVVFKQLNNQEQFFLIDSGSKKDIVEGMVAVYKNCLLGRVTQVFPHYSKITLITDKKCNVAAFCATTRSDGIVQGINDTQKLELKFVSHLQKMQKDDRVLSSGQGLVFPHGFGIGTVADCYVDGLHYCVTVKPLVDMQNVQYCYVIRKNKR